MLYLTKMNIQAYIEFLGPPGPLVVALYVSKPLYKTEADLVDFRSCSSLKGIGTLRSSMNKHLTIKTIFNLKDE